MWRVAVAEEDPEVQDQLGAFLCRYGQEHGVTLECHSFCGGTELLKRFRPIYDVILLRVGSEGAGDLAVAAELHQRDGAAALVLLSNTGLLAPEGYEIGAVGYLLRPLLYERFASAMGRAIHHCLEQGEGVVTLAQSGGMKRLRTRDIYYVEIQNHVLHYHTALGEFTLRGTMQGAERELCPHGFAKCNHWYLVNLSYVTEVNRKFTLVAGRALEVSRRNHGAFLAAVLAQRTLGGQAVCCKETDDCPTKTLEQHHPHL
jgi:DNA-binding LytR/AlgR family response regulator